MLIGNNQFRQRLKLLSFVTGNQGKRGNGHIVDRFSPNHRKLVDRNRLPLESRPGPKHSQTIAAWHQDSTYYGLGETPDVVTVWVALTEASHEAGCMDVMPYQSGGPKLFQHEANVIENSVNRAAQVITEPLDERGVRTMALKPGQFSMHHGLCPHRSGPNNAYFRRIGLGMNFFRPQERPVGKYRTAAMLVRGEDRYGHFENLSPPKAELDDDAIAAHEMAVPRYRETYYEQEALHLARSA